MKYLTPELFRRGNSSKAEEALAASDEWDLALKAYRKQLKSIRPKLPQSVRYFIENIYLHDCEVLGLTTTQTPTLSPQDACALLLVRQKGGMIVLTYRLLQPPKVERSVLPEALRSEPPEWLYDEFGLVVLDGLSHEIFTSDGSLIKFIFPSSNLTNSIFLSPAPRQRTTVI